MCFSGLFINYKHAVLLARTAWVAIAAHIQYTRCCLYRCCTNTSYIWMYNVVSFSLPTKLSPIKFSASAAVRNVTKNRKQLSKYDTAGWKYRTILKMYYFVWNSKRILFNSLVVLKIRVQAFVQIKILCSWANGITVLSHSLKTVCGACIGIYNYTYIYICVCNNAGQGLKTRAL